MLPFDTAHLLLIAVIFLAGGMVKGALGFGLPLVTIAVLPFFLAVEAALAVNSIVLVAVNALQFWQAGAWAAATRLAGPMLLGVALATPLGTAFATQLPRSVLVGLLGVFIMGFAVLQLLGLPRAAHAAAPSAPGVGRSLGAGVAGGFVGALTSSPGPIFVMHFAASRLERPLFMATLGLLMAAVGAVLAASLAVAGVFETRHLGLAAAALPASFMGFWLGDRLCRQLSVAAFRKGVLVLLCLLGAAMLQRALTAAA
ncbi:MAG: sulfite exporter TauE/SafE family protein [Pseudomonadota bacterium]